jgi:hypothetical protein
MTSRNLIAAIFLVAANALSGAGFPEEKGFVTGFAVDGIEISQNQPLTFGQIIAGWTAGTVTITPEGLRAVSGVVQAPAAGFGPSMFTVTITGNGNPNYTITMPPSTTLNGPGGASMLVDSFQRTATAGKVDPRTREETLNVGATLHIKAGQTAGAYSGTYPITVHTGN